LGNISRNVGSRYVTVAPRRIWIRLALVLCPAALAGCAVPLGFTVASYGIDGVAYATEGKSTTDMVISGVQSENCALLRVFSSKAICRPWNAAELAQIEQNKKDIARGHPNVILMSENEDFEQVGVQAPRKARLEDVNASEVASVPAGEAAPSAAPVAAVEAAPIAATSAPAIPAKAQDAHLARANAHPGDVYLVLASYSSREKAERARDLYQHAHPGLTFAVLDGPSYHRVASGPIAPGEIKAARARIVESLSVKNPWAMPACASAGGSGCAAMARLGVDTVQLASAAE
jgi:hypothetical protein